MPDETITPAVTHDNPREPERDGAPFTIRQIANALEEMATRYGDHPCYLWDGPIMALNVIPTCDGQPAGGDRKPNEFVIELGEQG